jgi:hypothetical protein
MRHTPFLIVATALLLGACARPISMAPEDVLNRSSVANSGLLSARLSFEAELTDANLQSEQTHVSLTAQGTMQQGGRQLDLAFATEGNTATGTQPMTWNATGRLTVVSENEVYVRVDALEANPALPLPADLSGVWYRLPSTGQSPADITPDPRYLRLQSESVRVTKDHGIVSMGGKRLYHYDVVIDPQRLAAYLSTLPEEVDAEGIAQTLSAYEATGEIWIEEDTFLLTKAVWNIRKKEDDTFSLQLAMNITDAGLPVTVTAPEDAQPLPQSSLLLPSTDTVILQEF